MDGPTGICTRCARPFDDHVLPKFAWGPAAKAGFMRPICPAPKGK